MLKFSSMAPELERLNELGYRLPLNDAEIKRMQNLNRSWSTASGQTTERFRYEAANLKKTFLKVHLQCPSLQLCLKYPLYVWCMVTSSKLQSFLLQQQTFLEKCETWMEFLVQTEENLAVEISGNYQSLIEQQKAHEVESLYFKMLAE